MGYETAVNDLLVRESGRISKMIYRRRLNSSVWLKSLIGQETWPEGMGYSISSLFYERVLPAETQPWADVAPNAGGASSCIPDATVIPVAQTLKSYNLQQTAVESLPICVNDLRYSFERGEQLKSVFDNLTQNVAWLWKDRYRSEYIRLAQHKVVLAAGLPEASIAMPETAPTSILVQGVLDKFYTHLNQDGAGDEVSDRENGRPVFVAVMSDEASAKLILDNPDVRQDYRESPRVSELLAPLGITRSYKGWYHMIDVFPPRWDFDPDAEEGEQWTEILPYAGTAATYGTKQEVNPAYQAAEYEDTILFHPMVYKSLVPAPITSPGGNTGFESVSYRGEFKWINEYDRTFNPDKNTGYFRGILMQGSKPVYPQWGYVLRHKRCPSTLGLVGC